MKELKYFDNFSLEKTINSGQLFRFKKLDENQYIVLSSNKFTKIEQTKNKLYISSEDVEYWYNFFDLNKNYTKLEQIYIEKYTELKEIIEYSSGIHILNQNLLEVFVNFIISQNNNIPRIKSIIDKLCVNYGQNIKGTEYNSFPDLETLKIQTFHDIGAGFRDKYLINGINQFDKIDFTLSFTEIEQNLLKIKGIGPKVCSCILLFGLHDFDVFPIDTHINQIIRELYFTKSNPREKELSEFVMDYFSQNRALIQQWLFYFNLKN